jgi:hypothetical protein
MFGAVLASLALAPSAYVGCGGAVSDPSDASASAPPDAAMGDVRADVPTFFQSDTGDFSWCDAGAPSTLDGDVCGFSQYVPCGLPRGEPLAYGVINALDCTRICTGRAGLRSCTAANDGAVDEAGGTVVDCLVCTNSHACGRCR